LTTGDFTESDNCAGSLAAYAGSSIPSCTVTIKFAPTASGFRPGAVQVATNAGVQTMTLGGSGPTPSGPAVTTTTLSASSYSVAQGQSVTLTARVAPTSGSGTPTGSVTFYCGTFALGTEALSSGAATFTANTATLSAGNYQLTAQYGGDTNNATSTASAITVTVTATLNATTTMLTANPQTVATGGSITLTAKVTRSVSGTPGGTVEFYTGSTLLGSATLSSGSAVLTISTTGYANGNYAIVADYEGDGADQPSASAPVTITISGSAAATQAVMAATPSIVALGASATLKATVTETSGSGTPSGTVTFYYETLALGKATLSQGVGSITASSESVPPGNYLLTAVYSGDSANQPATAAGITVTIQAPTRVTLTATPTTVTPGQTVTLTATIVETTGSGTPGGSVSFVVGSNILNTATVLNGVATFTASTTGVPSGTYPVVAQYLGDTADQTSTSSAVDVTIQ
jgi:hypothetical protein